MARSGVLEGYVAYCRREVARGRKNCAELAAEISREIGERVTASSVQRAVYVRPGRPLSYGEYPGAVESPAPEGYRRREPLSEREKRSIGALYERSVPVEDIMRRHRVSQPTAYRVGKQFARRPRVGRQASHECLPRGEAHPHAHLSEPIVIAIRAIKAQLDVPNAQVGQAAGTTNANVSYIARRKRWRHVSDRPLRPAEIRALPAALRVLYREAIGG